MITFHKIYLENQLFIFYLPLQIVLTFCVNLSLTNGMLFRFLWLVKVIDDNGQVNFVGMPEIHKMHRFAARARILDILHNSGYLRDTRDHTMVSTSKSCLVILWPFIIATWLFAIRLYQKNSSIYISYFFWKVNFYSMIPTIKNAGFFFFFRTQTSILLFHSCVKYLTCQI